MSPWRSPMWQAVIAPTAAPSQLRLILQCQDRLAGLPLTAHELGSGGDWTQQTLVASCQYSDTSGAWLVFRKLHFSGQILCFFTLLLEMFVSVCCSLTLPSLTTLVKQCRDAPGSPGATDSLPHVESLGLSTDMLLFFFFFFTVYPHIKIHCITLFSSPPLHAKHMSRHLSHDRHSKPQSFQHANIIPLYLKNMQLFTPRACVYFSQPQMKQCVLFEDSILGAGHEL